MYTIKSNNPLNASTSLKARSKEDAVTKYMDRYYKSFWGPKWVNDTTFEIYSMDGIRLNFTIKKDYIDTRH